MGPEKGRNILATKQQHTSLPLNIHGLHQRSVQDLPGNRVHCEMELSIPSVTWLHVFEVFRERAYLTVKKLETWGLQCYSGALRLLEGIGGHSSCICLPQRTGDVKEFSFSLIFKEQKRIQMQIILYLSFLNCIILVLSNSVNIQKYNLQVLNKL